MEYTPLSFVPRKGCIMNNASAEIASAAALGDKIRLFTVNPFGCPDSQPRCEPTPQRQLESVELKWQRASTKAFKPTRFTTFSAMCWLYGKQLQQALNVPVGLVASSKGGTAIQSWAPLPALQECGQNRSGSPGGQLGNTMLFPFAVGPMTFSTFIWCKCAPPNCPLNQHD